MKRALLCVVTGSYLPMAVTMAKSYAKHHPEDAIRVLLVDVMETHAVCVKIAELPQLKADGIDTIRSTVPEKMRMYYDAAEMVGALRSSYIKKILFEEGYEQIVMLDADIFCYAPLTPFFDALQTHSIALTPHVTSPPPDDGSMPDDMDLTISGFINNGCCAVKADEQSKQALDWLEAKVRHSCFLIRELNLYNEQSWVSFLPWFFPDTVGIVRDAGMNVAYWNIYERALTTSNGVPYVNGVPLRFFHYSGYSLKAPHALTLHSGRSSKSEALPALLKEYSAALRADELSIPKVAADLPCSTEPLSKRLQRYKAQWGRDVHFIKRFKRQQWLGFYEFRHTIINHLRVNALRAYVRK